MWLPSAYLRKAFGVIWWVHAVCKDRHSVCCKYLSDKITIIDNAIDSDFNNFQIKFFSRKINIHLHIVRLTDERLLVLILFLFWNLENRFLIGPGQRLLLCQEVKKDKDSLLHITLVFHLALCCYAPICNNNPDL